MLSVRVTILQIGNVYCLHVEVSVKQIMALKRDPNLDRLAANETTGREDTNVGATQAGTLQRAPTDGRLLSKSQNSDMHPVLHSALTRGSPLTIVRSWSGGSLQPRLCQGGPSVLEWNPARVSVVIPALNEEKTIAEIVEGCKPFANQVIVVDGRSQDRTSEIARNTGASIVVDDGKGKGRAMRAALPHIQGEITVFIDADGSHDPQDIPRLLQPILRGEADHVSGSRMLGGSSELHGTFNEFFRLAGSGFINTVINLRFGVRLSDCQNGFRAIKTAVLKDLDLQEHITTIEQEMIIKTLKKGYKMGEVPTHEHARRYGTSHIRLGRVWLRYGYSLVKNLL